MDLVKTGRGKRPVARSLHTAFGLSLERRWIRLVKLLICGRQLAGGRLGRGGTEPLSLALGYGGQLTSGFRSRGGPRYRGDGARPLGHRTVAAWLLDHRALRNGTSFKIRVRSEAARGQVRVQIRVQGTTVGCHPVARWHGRRGGALVLEAAVYVGAGALPFLHHRQDFVGRRREEFFARIEFIVRKVQPRAILMRIADDSLQWRRSGEAVQDVEDIDFLRSVISGWERWVLNSS
ncbi:hypothetical protein B0H12DRAFT_319796 [Mycena haematopus]|nr:hypothetical protein B0H12DRAFT_319796 [Mycena haematopus]